jgi:hypothetical protein
MPTYNSSCHDAESPFGRTGELLFGGQEAFHISVGGVGSQTLSREFRGPYFPRQHSVYYDINYLS